MATKTEDVEIVKIVTFSEIHLYHCLCEVRGFKIVRRSCRKKEEFNKKGVLKNFEKLTEKHLCLSPTQVFFLSNLRFF